MFHEFHQALGAQFTSINETEAVAHYGDPSAEYLALQEKAGLIDLSFRSRICLTGPDRTRLLNGQVTNNVIALKTGHGCYAALVSAKGRIESDLNVYCLDQELLLDFEPGLTSAVISRFEKYIIADDVDVTDVSPHYHLLTVQGPRAATAVSNVFPDITPPAEAMASTLIQDPTLGDIYCVNLPRFNTTGFDLYVPTAAFAAVADKLIAATRETGGRACGWEALEVHRIEAGIPRFGIDMDESNLAPETGIESRAISYSKGCYIGQEVIARIRTYGQVKKTLCGFHLQDDIATLPAKGSRLFRNEKEAGYLTSVIRSPRLKKIIALGYARREHNAVGTKLTLPTPDAEVAATIVELPFTTDPEDLT